jgi:signal transduction histidine kinase
VKTGSAIRLALVPTAIAYGLIAESVASDYGSTTTYAGGSGWATAVELAAGWGLVAAGLLTWQVRPTTRVGPLLVGAGFAWFAPDWVGWEGGPAWIRSVGMLAAGVWLALLVHAALVSPQRRLDWLPARALVGTVYVETAVVGIGQALFRDPFDVVDCWNNCTANSFLVRSDRTITDALVWVDLRFAILVAAAFVALAAVRLRAATAPARGLLAPVLLCGAAVTVVHAAHAIALLRIPLEAPSRPAFLALFVAEGLAVSALALAFGWDLVQARRTRRAVERLVVDLAQTPEPGALEAALARATGDPSLTIGFRRQRSDEYVDSSGRPAPAPTASATRTITPIVRAGRTIALLAHDRAVLDEAFHREIGAAVRMAVENERLRAEALAQLRELRESRARIVETSDSVRRQLERDLHDGAQQRLVALSFGVRLALGELGQMPDAALAKPLADAEHALNEALAAVRSVANGLFPATLTSAGLAYAIEELAAFTPIQIEIESVPDQRLPSPVEAAAYGLIREAVENAVLHADAGTVSVSVRHADGAVVVDAADDGIGGADPGGGVGLLDVADRVGALGGRFRIVSPIGGGTRIHAEIPCV